MSRKPAHLDMAGGKGPRQRIWDTIRGFPGEFTTDLICRRVDVPLDLIRVYVKSLLAGGYLKQQNTPGRGVMNVYTLLLDVGVEAPRLKKDGSPVTQGLAQENMWRFLRTNKGDVNARELAAFSSVGDIVVRENTANSYLQNLKYAGYLQCTAEGKGRGGKSAGGILARYRLIKNTGPRPPMVQRAEAIYDPNTDTVTLLRPVNDETAIYGH